MRPLLAPLVIGGLGLALLVPPPPAGAAPAAPTCQGVRATLVGTPGDDVLTGTAGRDVIVGLDGNDRIDARGGDDLVCGGDGFDVLTGGAGDDRLHGGLDGNEYPFDADFRSNAGDVLDGGPGDDVLDPGRDPDATLRGIPGGFETLDVLSFASSVRGVVVDLARGVATGQGRDTIVGTGMVQVLATRHDDVVRAGRGPVRFVTGAGDDVLVGSDARDALSPDGATTAMPGLRNDPRIGTGGDDVVRAGGGADEVITSAGRDDVRAGAGPDELILASQAPGRAWAGTGDDRVNVFVGRLDQTLVRIDPDGRDALYLSLYQLDDVSPTWDLESGVMTTAGGARAVIEGAAHVSLGLDARSVATITGTERGEVLAVESGRTVFSGLGGDDVFSGYTRRDTFDGGAGTDTYRRDYGELRSNTCVSVERDPQRWCAAAE